MIAREIQDSIPMPVKFISNYTHPIVNIDSLQQASYNKMLDSIFESNNSKYDTQIIQEPVNKKNLVNEIILEKGKAYLEPTEREFHSDNYTTIIVLLIFALLGVIAALEGKKINQLYKAIIGLSYASVLKREEKTISRRSSFLLLLVFLFTTSLVLFNGIIYNNYSTMFSNNLILFIAIIASIITAYFIKIFSVIILGFIFEKTVMVSDYVFNILLFNVGLGIVLFPFLILYFYTPLPKDILLIISFSIISFFIVYRILRSIYISFQQGAFISYIFLYFCALEILPLIVLIKILIKQ
jgi:hypothetical protein